jgi:hypothetical protein
MTPAPVSTRSRATALLWLFLLANYAIALAICAGFVTGGSLRAPGPALWIAAVWLSYSFFYLLPAFGLAWFTQRLLGRFGAVVAWAPAVVVFAAVQLGIYADRRIHEIYGFHINGFVWNLVTTRGGFESLGAGSATLAEAFGLAVFVVAGEAALLAALARKQHVLGAWRSRRFVVGFIAGLFLFSQGERLAYAGADARAYNPILQWSAAFPLYLPIKLDAFATRLGLAVERTEPLTVGLGDSRLVYPRRPLVFRPGAPPWNVIVLCAESLRADALEPEVMPATWRFASQATRFTEHLSSGNGTRMGVFGLFYGLPGPYWFEFLAQTRGPALIRALLDRGYDVRGWTSDKFSYPEFSRTVFADVESAKLSEGGVGDGWQRDRAQVGRVLAFLAQRDPAQPFFLYMFFESPHAPYRFPPETAIRTPYLGDLDYLTMNLKRDIRGIENRYWNSVRHLDTQLERIYAALAARELLDSTIVVVTGDHGEEFLEKGLWGHNSEFHEEQIRVPLVLWVPGRAPAVIDRMTSHLDMPATLLALLGATNPPEEFSLGQSLLDGPPRSYALVSDWSRVGYVDAGGKVSFATNPAGWFKQIVSDRRDAPLADPGGWLRAHTAIFGRLLADLARFTQGPEVAAAPATRS